MYTVSKSASTKTVIENGILTDRRMVLAAIALAAYIVKASIR